MELLLSKRTDGKRGAENGSHCTAPLPPATACRHRPPHRLLRYSADFRRFYRVPWPPQRVGCIYISPASRLRTTTHSLPSLFPFPFPFLQTPPRCTAPFFLDAALPVYCPFPAWCRPTILRSPPFSAGVADGSLGRRARDLRHGALEIVVTLDCEISTWLWILVSAILPTIVDLGPSCRDLCLVLLTYAQFWESSAATSSRANHLVFLSTALDPQLPF
jgi:hypothetical protein